MISLNQKSTIKKKSNWSKNWQKRLIYSLIDLLFTIKIDHRFFIKPRSSLIDQIYMLTMKSVFFHCQKKNRKIDHSKTKRSIIYDENLWWDRKIYFWRSINRSWSKMDFWSTSNSCITYHASCLINILFMMSIRGPYFHFIVHISVVVVHNIHHRGL